MNERFYLLEIQLFELEPAIWRRFVVPGCITLDRLHDVIQIVMGWTDSHLHEFIIGKKRYTEYPESKEDGLECGKYRLVDLIKQKGRKFHYKYDFGDGWNHQLVILDSRYHKPEGDPHVFCLGGARACPPEDVGGVHGYFEFCAVLQDPTHEEYEAYKTWIGGDFDSEKFDLDTVNMELLKYLRWSRDRYQNWGFDEDRDMIICPF